MPVQKRSRVASFALSALASAVIGAAVLPPVHAAGLGKLTVLSALGQPLRAEIELTAVTPEEANGLAVRLAPPDAFRAANIEFNPALLNLRFDVEQRDGRRFIRVSSSQPVNEPFVDMLLELSSANGRLVREYTFLLDPADMRNTQSPQVAAPVDLNRNAPPGASAAPAAAQPAPARAADRAQTDDIRVKRGDTLSGIASGIKPADVSLDMMLVALFRANPEAFAGNNMNRLKSGKILSVPDAGTVRATDRGEARRIVVAHAADFNAYRNRLAAQVEAATPAQAPAAQQSAGGKITAKVEERPNAVAEAQDKLKLSKAGEASGKAGEAGAAGGVEDKIAKDQQVADAAVRVKELEKNVSDLEKLMAVKSQAGADAQNGAAVPEMDNRGGPVAAAPQPVAPAAAPARPAAPPPAVVPAQPMEPGIMDALKDNMQALGIALAAILGGTALILARRRKAREAAVVQHTPAPAPVPAPAEPTTQALFDETGGQNVDTGNSVFNSNFAPSASQLDMNEVDPVAEADVYIAYGRDAQAEEILKEALRTYPERHAARLKLMEIYANRKDLRAFEVQANELFALTKGQGDEWAQGAALGRSIDPGNPLYAAAGGAGPLAATAAAAGAAALAAEAAHAAAQPAAPADFAAVLDDAARARAEPAPHEGLDLDLSSEPAPEAAVDALDFDFADTPAPAAQDRPAAFDAGDATAQPDVPEQPAAPAQPKVGDAGDAEHYLDFDLGGLNFEPNAPTAPPAHTQEAAPADALDFAFDLPPEPAQPAPAPAEPDFDLDLPGDKAAPAAAAPGSDPLAELDLMDFDVPPPAQADNARPPADPAPALDDADFGLPELPQAPAAAPPPPEFDLSGIDLDLDETATPQAEPAPAPLSPLQMEMDTKLDLAVAYQEIGDKEGARELLDEVLRGGTDEQVARANRMLAQLG
jgi:pilus assembly protein FimV